MHRAAMEIRLPFKVDSTLLNLNVIMLQSEVVEAVTFRLFYFDSNGESVDITPISLSILMSLRDEVDYMLSRCIVTYESCLGTLMSLRGQINYMLFIPATIY